MKLPLFASRFLNHLPKLIAQPLSLALELSKHEDFGIREFRRIEHDIKRSDDWRTLNRKLLEIRNRYSVNTLDAPKYLDTDYWLRVNILRAARIGLHRSPALKILDLGCGSGLFLLVCRHLGHQVWGADQPAQAMRDCEKLVYGSFISSLHIEMMPLHIERFKHIELPAQYDLITAFLICFNRCNKADEWGAKEWEYFVHDACKNLHDEGRLVLSLNANRERYGKLEFYDEPTQHIFSALGTINRPGEVIICTQGGCPLGA
jgi:SAM-dependent methyltransferase